MLKMTIDNEEVLSNNDISIKEEILSPSSTILNNVYPKTWEQDKDYVSRFYYPKDYSKLNIQNFSVEPEEAGTTIQVNGNATLTDVDTTKESRVLRLLGQTSQTTTTTGKNLFNKDTITDGYRLDGSGEPSVVATNEFTSDFIEISPSTQYVRSTGGINAYTRTCFYDSTKAFISKDDSNQTFTTPSNAKYLRFSEYTSRLDTTQLEKGATPTTYEPFIPNSPSPSYPQPIQVVSGDNEINICGKNLFNPSNVILNREISSGVIVYSTNSNMYYMKVDIGTTYNFSRKSSTNSGLIGFADEIPNTGVTTYDRTSLSNITSISKTATHKYLVLQLYQVEDLSETMVEVGNTKTTYEPYIGNSYPLYLGVENLIEDNKIYLNSGLSDSGVIFSNAPTRTTIYKVPVLPNLTYTVSCANGYQIGNIFNYNSSETWTNTTTFAYSTSHTFTNSSTTYFISFVMKRDDNGNMTSSDLPLLKVQLEKGSKVNSYSAYGTTPIELCKIGTYQDYIYKEDGSWYLHKEIGKVVLDGTETGWSYDSTYKYFRTNTYDFGTQIPMTGFSGMIQYSNYFTLISSWGTFRDSTTTDSFYWVQNSGYKLCFRNIAYTTTSGFTTWLSTNKPSVYYILANSTAYEITDTTLLEQLESLSS